MRQLIVRFANDESGSILLLTALLMAIFIALAGAGYDLGKEQLIKEHTQQAMDAAAISGGVTDQDNAVAGAQKFYNVNFPETFMGMDPATITPTVTIKQGVNVTLTANYTVNTGFTKTIGAADQNITSTSSAPLKTVYNATDLILVVDNSDSMKKKDLGNSTYTLHSDWKKLQNGVGGVPKTGCIYFADLYKGSQADNFRSNKDCLQGNGKDGGLQDQAFSDNRLNSLRYNVDLLANTLLIDNADAGDHYNQVAMVAFADTVSIGDGLLTSFDFKKTYADTTPYIMSMFTATGTNTTNGMKKALTYTSSGLYRSGSTHVVVLLTDGLNNNTGDVGDPNPPNNPNDNYATNQICNQFKNDKDAIIFTILFGDQSDLTQARRDQIDKFLSTCASLPATGPNGHYFLAKDSDALKKAFDEIIKTTHNVRLQQ